MTKISISEASRLTGQDRSTLHRHIKNGKLSKDFDADGKPVLDTSELARVYPDKFKAPVVLQQSKTLKNNTLQQHATPRVSNVETAEIELLKLKLQHAEEKLSIEEARRHEAEQREREAKEETKQLLTIIEKQTYLLPAPQLAPELEKEPLKPKFWKRLFG